MTKTVTGKELLAMKDVTIFSMVHKPNGVYRLDYAENKALITAKPTEIALNAPVSVPTPPEPQCIRNDTKTPVIAPSEPEIVCVGCGQMIVIGQECNICVRMEKAKDSARKNRRDWAWKQRAREQNGH